MNRVLCPQSQKREELAPSSFQTYHKDGKKAGSLYSRSYRKLDMHREREPGAKVKQGVWTGRGARRRQEAQRGAESRKSEGDQ